MPGMPGIIGSTGWDRSSAWIWAFSSTHSTTARSGWVVIEADHVDDLLHEQRVGGQLEPVLDVRFEVEPLPDPPDRGLAQAAALRHRRPRPVGGVLRQLLQG